MRSIKQIDFTRRARIIKAMGHPSRLAMLHALANGEKCVCDLQRLVGSDMSTVSKHLSVMKKAGLVEDRKDGLRVHYRLRVPCMMGFMECVEAVLNQQRQAVCCAGR
jgi:ArsR family transcriptional regulator